MALDSAMWIVFEVLESAIDQQVLESATDQQVLKVPHLSLVLGSATYTGAGECHVGY